MCFTNLSPEQASSGLAVVSAGKHWLPFLRFPFLPHYCVKLRHNFPPPPWLEQVTGGNSTEALRLGLNRFGNRLLRAPVPRPDPAPTDVGTPGPLGPRAPRPRDACY